MCAIVDNLKRAIGKNVSEQAAGLSYGSFDLVLFLINPLLIYINVLQNLYSIHSISDLELSVDLFQSISDWKDAKVQLNSAESMLTEAKEEERRAKQYQIASDNYKASINSYSVDALERTIALLDEMGDYKDCRILKDNANKALITVQRYESIYQNALKLINGLNKATPSQETTERYIAGYTQLENISYYKDSRQCLDKLFLVLIIKK